MQALAEITLAVHLAWILWVIFGAFWTQGRPVLAAFHLLSLVWGIIVEVTVLPCPLTLAEQVFENKVGAGAPAYRGSFVLHYLDSMVYPNLPEWLLVCCGVAICLLNLAIYARRFRRRHRISRSSVWFR
ncbi:MAG: DUF2784 domain-containing protein [Bryobacteraceae bacterium]